MSPDTLIHAFVTLFVVIDPIGLAPLFLALTRGMDAGHRRAVAVRAVLIAAGLLTVFGLAGQQVLDLFGISMAAFRIAGGALLFLTALEMLFEKRKTRREDQTKTKIDPSEDPSVFPLGIPLIAGPGAMASMILLMGHEDDWVGKLSVLGVMVALLIVVLTFFLAAGWLGRLLKETGINVVTRLLGMLLAALAIQFIIDGLSGTPLFSG